MLKQDLTTWFLLGLGGFFAYQVFLKPVTVKATATNLSERPTIKIPPKGSLGYNKWIQSSINQITGTNLQLDGILGSLSKKAIGDFQKAVGLINDGIVGPQTENAIVQFSTLSS